MRIGLLSPSIYMSPSKYKDMIFAPRDLSIILANGLVRNGHEVYFFTAPDIKTDANLVAGDEVLLNKSFVEEKLKDHEEERFKWASFYNVKRNYELDLTLRAYRMAKEGKLDIIHSYHDTLAHFFDDLTNFPTVYTLHDPLPTNKNTLAYWLLDKFKHHNYISISNSFRGVSVINDLNFVATVYHGISLEECIFSEGKGRYIAFVGRMAEEKGAIDAIEVSKKISIPISIASSSAIENTREKYYAERVLPIIDKQLVSFTGFLNNRGKYSLLSKASCLLFPIHWEEPFGLVMIEAMACGAPVIAYNRGSVSEIVRDGVTGFIIDPDGVDRPGRGNWVIKKQGIEGLIEAVRRVGEIDRSACRKHVEQNFSVEKMVDSYLKVYERVLSFSENFAGHPFKAWP